MIRWLIFLFLCQLIPAHAEELAGTPTTEKAMASGSETADRNEETGKPSTQEEPSPEAETPLLFTPTDNDRVTEEFEAEFPVDI